MKRFLITYLVLLVLVAALPLGVCAQQPDASADTALVAVPAEGKPELTPEEKKAELEARVQADPADGVAWNDLGVLYASEEDFTKARDCFINAVQTAPTEGDYHRNLGVAFSHLDMDEMALREFQAYRSLDKLGGKDYWRLIGNAQLRSGQKDEAAATFREGIAALGPDLSPDTMRLVLSLLKISDEDGDEETERELLGQYASRAAAWLQVHEDGQDGWLEAGTLVKSRVAMLIDDAKLMEQSGLPAEAAPLYQEAYDLEPERLDLLPHLVDSLLSADREMDARVVARLARDRAPDQPGTWIASGKVIEHAGRLEDAAAAYEKAFDLDSSLEDVRVAIGNILLRLGRDAEASRYLSAGLNTSVTKPEVVYNYAVSLMREKKYHAAVPALRRVVQDRPEMAQAWEALANCCLATRQYSAAIEPFEKAYAFNPDPKLIFLAGSCAQKAERPDRAIADYTQALAADPTYVKARYNLSLAYRDAGLYTEAAASFDELIKLEGPSYRAYYSQGLAYYYLKDYPAALGAFELGLEYKETPELLNAIGRVHAATGDKKEAVAWYDMAKKLQGGS
ncbi:tetratricopeptide repeat protein [bacterium]|nr:tetratricopeptide repeat protein [bacterium]PIV81888.1 MAG: hypothetical protein COW53_01930 [bacterium CG17_big_fil_post_rev_8_21_14_2_50_64_8]PJA73667.1 MAG: hypothetical protein CO151_12665 [bacterium CG_4_9_14_3_um_filter_65_15]